MDKHLTQMLRDHNLKLKYEDIHGDGFIVPTRDDDPDFVVVRQNASDELIEKVILHEIGHAENDDACICCNYKNNYSTRSKSEYEANSFMIRERVAKYVAYGNDVKTSNYINLANSIGVKDYDKVKSELRLYMK